MRLQERVTAITGGAIGIGAALFLTSEDASYITGHTLAVDCGYLAGGLWSRASGSPPTA